MLCFDITARPQYTNATAITQYVYSDSDAAELVCPFEFGLLRGMISPYNFTWQLRQVFTELAVPVTNVIGRTYNFSDNNRTLLVNLSTHIDGESYLCQGLVQRCNSSDNPACEPDMTNSPFITPRVVGR